MCLRIEDGWILRNESRKYDDIDDADTTIYDYDYDRIINIVIFYDYSININIVIFYDYSININIVILYVNIGTATTL